MISKRILFWAAVISFSLFVNSTSQARDAAGNLTFIQAPLSTTPQIVQPGGAITVDVAEPVYNNCGCAFHLYLLVDNQQMELGGVVHGTDPATSTYRFSATIPAGLETGLYDLIAIKGANRDNALRAVAVVEDVPAEYSVLHIHEPQVSLGGGTGHLLELASELAGKNITAFVVITGVPTASTSQEDMLRFYEITDKFPVATFVDDPATSAPLGVLPRSFTFADSLFLLSAPKETSTESVIKKTCAESVIKDLAAQGKVSEADMKTLDKMTDSLYFETDGTAYHVVPNTKDDDCLKAVNDTFVTPPLSGGQARLLTFKNGKLTGNKLIDIKP